MWYAEHLFDFSRAGPVIRGCLPPGEGTEPGDDNA
jgi:hypothetical protein